LYTATFKSITQAMGKDKRVPVGPPPLSRGWWHVFTAVDMVSEMFFAKPTKYANWHNTTDALEQLVHQYGPPH